MISILQFTNAVMRGGAEEQILMLLRGLDRRIFRVHLACPPVLAKRLATDLPPDVKLLPLDFQQPYHLSRAWQFRSILQVCGIDILHSHHFYSSLCASPIGWMAG